MSQIKSYELLETSFDIQKILLSNTQQHFWFTKGQNNVLQVKFFEILPINDKARFVPRLKN